MNYQGPTTTTQDDEPSTQIRNAIQMARKSIDIARSLIENHTSLSRFSGMNLAEMGSEKLEIASLILNNDAAFAKMDEYDLIAMISFSTASIGEFILNNERAYNKIISCDIKEMEETYPHLAAIITSTISQGNQRQYRVSVHEQATTSGTQDGINRPPIMAPTSTPEQIPILTASIAVNPVPIIYAQPNRAADQATTHIIQAPENVSIGFHPVTPSLKAQEMEQRLSPSFEHFQNYACSDWRAFSRCIGDENKRSVADKERILSLNPVKVKRDQDAMRIGRAGSATGYTLTNIKKVADFVKDAQSGCCTTFAMACAQILFEMNDMKDERIEIVSYEPKRKTGSHCFVVLNRQENSDLNNPATWGPDALIVDGWKSSLYCGEVFTIKNFGGGFLAYPGKEAKLIQNYDSSNVDWLNIVKRRTDNLQSNNTRKRTHTNISEDIMKGMILQCDLFGPFYYLFENTRLSNKRIKGDDRAFLKGQWKCLQNMKIGGNVKIVATRNNAVMITKSFHEPIVLTFNERAAALLQEILQDISKKSKRKTKHRNQM